jgi:hypothetical protein
VANDATYTYIAGKYFDMKSGTIAKNIKNYIDAGNYDSFTAAAIVNAILNVTDNQNEQLVDSITVFADDTPVETTTIDNTLIAHIPYETNKIRINCDTCKSKNSLFYTLVTSGYPKTLSETSNGVEISRKYYDLDGNEINSAKIGDMLDVKITVRTRGVTDNISNAVISDLLPGGFVPISDTLAGSMDFSEIREDRVLIYTQLGRTPKTFTYRAQMSVAGEFTVPPITANDMYNPTISAVGQTGTFTVSNATD